MNAQCPECDSWVAIPTSVKLWDTHSCPECDTELQLVSLNPAELDYAGWDDDDYDDDDDDDYY